MSATTYSHIHILADRPSVNATGKTYPSITFGEADGLPVDEVEVTITVSGNRADRLEFAGRLRQAALQIEEWQPEAPDPSEGDVVIGGLA